VIRDVEPARASAAPNVHTGFMGRDKLDGGALIGRDAPPSSRELDAPAISAWLMDGASVLEEGIVLAAPPSAGDAALRDTSARSVSALSLRLTARSRPPSSAPVINARSALLVK
jgi:hypothetical protein